MNSSQKSSPGPVAHRAGSSEYAEPERGFYQQRLALFGCTIMCFVIAAWAAVYGLVSPSKFATAGSFFLLLVAAVAGIQWVSCRKIRHPIGTLRLIDIACLLLSCILLAMSAWADRESIYTFAGRQGGVTFLIIARAALVPSTPRFTTLLNALAYVPICIAAWLTIEGTEIVWPEGVDKPSFRGFVVGAAINLALAAVITRVIHGLRDEIKEAVKLGQYTLEEKLGYGGMGDVYKASHALLHRPAAIKLLRRYAEGNLDLERFEREVQLSSELNHPNTISIFDFGRTPLGHFYYVMEYLEGADFGLLVRSCGAQSEARTLHMLRQALASLAEAHEAGLLHRDIKPGNLFLCEHGWTHDTVKVLDFGLVKKIRADDGERESDEQLQGTPQFMAPEFYRQRGEEDARSDLYSVACVAYFLICGEHVFEGSDIFEILERHQGEIPQPPSQRGAKISSEFESIILRCLAKDPGDRPSDARSLIELLETCSSQRPWTPEDSRNWWGEHAKTLHQARDAARTESGENTNLPRNAPTITEILPKKKN